MVISGEFQLLVRGFAGVIFCLFFESCAAPASTTNAPEPSGRMLTVSVTAYCYRGKTSSGIRTQSGVAAADPRVLPQGSIIRLGADGRANAATYTILDTGTGVRGRRIDIYIASCEQARRFGRRTMTAEVLRRGWDESVAVTNVK